MEPAGTLAAALGVAEGTARAPPADLALARRAAGPPIRRRAAQARARVPVWRARAAPRLRRPCSTMPAGLCGELGRPAGGAYLRPAHAAKRRARSGDASRGPRSSRTVPSIVPRPAPPPRCQLARRALQDGALVRAIDRPRCSSRSRRSAVEAQATHAPRSTSLPTPPAAMGHALPRTRLRCSARAGARIRPPRRGPRRRPGRA